MHSECNPMHPVHTTFEKLAKYFLGKSKDDSCKPFFLAWCDFLADTVNNWLNSSKKNLVWKVINVKIKTFVGKLKVPLLPQSCLTVTLNKYY